MKVVRFTRNPLRWIYRKLTHADRFEILESRLETFQLAVIKVVSDLEVRFRKVEADLLGNEFQERYAQSVARGKELSERYAKAQAEEEGK